MNSLRGQDLLIATSNAGKLAEFTALLAPWGTRVLSLRDFNLGEPDETEHTFSGNARLKARAACVATGLPALADDSGLSVDALGGWPGIYTADWAELRHGRDFHHAMSKVRHLLLSTSIEPPWAASFHCILALAQPNGEDVVFEGHLSGQIVWPMRGKAGHGYDPIFQPDGMNQTMGELTATEKNLISHRSVALRKFTHRCFT